MTTYESGTVSITSNKVSTSTLRVLIDELDTIIIDLVRRRTEISREIGALRAATGGPRIVADRERVIVARYTELGEPGEQLAAALLRLGRGPFD